MVVDLKGIVDELSWKKSRDRREIVKAHLERLGLPYTQHKFRVGMHSNIFVDLVSKNDKMLVLASHYDVVRGSPGANDNASAVAALLGALGELKGKELQMPVRAFFFDCEERNLRGSREFINAYGIQQVGAVCNMELVGAGTVPVMWGAYGVDQQYGDALFKTTIDLGQRPVLLGLVPTFTGDHKSFQAAGINNSMCLSMIDEKDTDLLREVMELPSRIYSSEKEKHTYVEHLSGRMRASATFRDYHKKTDTPDKIRPESLAWTRDFLVRLAENYK
ncbi:MAG: M28 family peptidase [Candidatus Nanoarchaeia archaeon]